MPFDMRDEDLQITLDLLVLSDLWYRSLFMHVGNFLRLFSYIWVHAIGLFSHMSFDMGHEDLRNTLEHLIAWPDLCYRSLFMHVGNWYRSVFLY